MPIVVCLHSNIHDENQQKRLRGESWESSQEFVDAILAGDEKAGRLPRIAVVEIPKRKPGRPKKSEVSDDQAG